MSQETPPFSLKERVCNRVLLNRDVFIFDLITPCDNPSLDLFVPVIVLVVRLH